MKKPAHRKIRKALDGMGKKHAEAMKHLSALEKHEKGEMKASAKKRGRPAKKGNPY